MPPWQKHPVNCPRNTMKPYSHPTVAAWIQLSLGWMQLRGKKRRNDTSDLHRWTEDQLGQPQIEKHKATVFNLIYRHHYFLPSSATKNTVTMKIKLKKQFILYPILLTERFQTARLPISNLKTKAKVALKQLAWAHLLPGNTSKPPSPTLLPSEPSLPWTVPRNRLWMQYKWIYCFCNPGNSSYRGDVTFRFANANLIPF